MSDSYLLDTGIIFGFQKSKHLDALVGASRVVNLAIVEEVYDEVVTHALTKHRGHATEAKELLATSKVAIHRLKLASPEAATHQAIRAGKSSATADLGESASIAWAIHNATVTFVTNDPAAARRSLQELRGRTMSFHPFLAMLGERGAVPVERCAKIAVAVQALTDWGAREPLWWSRWLDPG